MNQKIIQITAGRGPAECCWVVAKVLKYFLQEAQSIGVTYTILQREKGIENGTVQSASIRLEGKEVASFLKSWIGTIQWIGNSTFRKYHKRKNWFIAMYEVEQFYHDKVNEKDITYQAMRSSGPGGQHVNKVSSAIRAIHQPTGINVVAMDSRSQHQNKKIATKRLIEKIQEAELEKIKKSLATQWENHLAIQRGNPIRVFKGTDFKKQTKIKNYKNQRNQLKQELKNKLKT
ncbi:peptide chain release factor H [Aquimarina aquimarini]|uniref:peptide chain release factor H n=1 Tax=Aquimarina aquimarini TaxID=1191734 RepID=UPI000D556631|nr:peptide chain release factor H [Aquimarina aquimarini]